MKRFTQKMLAAAMAATLAVSSLTLSAVTASAALITTNAQGSTPATGTQVTGVSLNKLQVKVAEGASTKGSDLLLATILPNNAEVQGVTWYVAANAAQKQASDTASGDAYDAAIEAAATNAGNAVFTENGTTVAGIDALTFAQAKQANETGSAGARSVIFKSSANVTDAEIGTIENAGDAGAADAAVDAIANFTATEKTAIKAEATAADKAAKATDIRTASQTDAIAEVKAAILADVAAAKSAARTSAATIAAAKAAKAAAATVDEQGYLKDGTDNGYISITKVNSEGKVDTTANADKLNKYIQITGLSAGTSSVKVVTNDGSYSAVCAVEITTPIAVDPEPNVGFKLDKLSVTLGTDATYTLKPTIVGEKDAQGKAQVATATADDITWTSSDETILTVSDKGVVTPKKAGTAYVTATLKDKFAWGGERNYTYQTTFTVTNPVAATGISLDSTKGTVKVGESVTLKALVTPSNASNKKVKWSVYNTDVAKIEEQPDVELNGVTYSVAKITGLKAGSTEVYAIAESGSYMAKYALTVGNNGTVVKDTGVSLNVPSGTIKVDQTVEIEATILPSNATDTALTWVSTDDTIATVTAAGSVVRNGVTKYLAHIKGLKAGYTTIKVRTANGNEATCAVTVSSTDSSWSETKIGIQDADKQTYRMSQGLSHAITFNPTPANATVTWSSSNNNWATVNQNGVVTFIGAGTVTITGTIQMGTSKVSESVTMTIVDDRNTGVTTTKPLFISLDGKTEKDAIKIPNKSTQFPLKAILQGALANYNPADLIWNDNNSMLNVVNGIVTFTERDIPDTTSFYETIVTVSTADRQYSDETHIFIYKYLDPKDSDIASDGVIITLDGKTEINEIKAKWKPTLKDIKTQLKPVISGQTYKTSDLRWSVDKPGLANVDPNGVLTITADKNALDSQGTARFTITTQSADGKISDTAVVVISSKFNDNEAHIVSPNAGDPYELAVDGEKVKNNGTVDVEAPKSGSETVQVRPIWADDSEWGPTDLTWTSSDRNVAPVDTMGNVTVKPVTKPASVTITAEAPDGYKRAVVLEIAPFDDGADIDDAKELSFNPDSLTFTEGDSGRSVASNLKGGAKTPITWTTSNPSVATVDKNGFVTPKGAGRATITATDKDGDSASFDVIVNAKAVAPDSGKYAGMSEAELDAYIKGLIAEAVKDNTPVITPGADTNNNGKGNPGTGVELAVIPALIAGAAGTGAFVFKKKKK